MVSVVLPEHPSRSTTSGSGQSYRHWLQTRGTRSKVVTSMGHLYPASSGRRQTTETLTTTKWIANSRTILKHAHIIRRIIMH